MADEWHDISEEDGITLGPEEALEREIAKSKALKVERLQLKDQVERLTAQNRSLRDQLERLNSNTGGLSGNTGQQHETSPDRFSEASPPPGGFLSTRWASFLLAFNLVAIGLLAYFLLQHPAP